MDRVVAGMRAVDTVTRAVILGSAACLPSDMDALLAIRDPWDGLVVVVNETGVYYTGRIHHWISLHGEKLKWWRNRREGNRDYTPWIAPPSDGSSGGAAVSVVLDEIGCERVVLCGMPMDTSPHLGRGNPWTAAPEHRPWWVQNAPLFRDRVRSMSGWTAGLLGIPDAAWLEGR